MYPPTHSPVQACTLPHIQIVPQSHSLSNSSVPFKHMLLVWSISVSVNQLSCRICPVGQSLHVCFSDGFGSLTHMQAYCSLKSPVSCSSLTTLLTLDVWVFSPHTNQFSNSPDTIWVSYNSVLTLSARVSGDPDGWRVHSHETAPSSGENGRSQATHTLDWQAVD